MLHPDVFLRWTREQLHQWYLAKGSRLRIYEVPEPMSIPAGYGLLDERDVVPLRTIQYYEDAYYEDAPCWKPHSFATSWSKIYKPFIAPIAGAVARELHEDEGG